MTYVAELDDFYATVHRYCERHPPRPRPAAKKRGRKVTFTEINLGNRGRGETQMTVGDGVAYVAPGGVGLVELRPGRVPVRVADIDDVEGRAVAGTRLYMLSDFESGSGEVLAASSNGGRSFKSIVTGYFNDLVAAGHGVCTLRDGRLVHYPSGRSRAAKGRDGECNRIGGTGPAGRFAFTSSDLRLLGTGRDSCNS